MNDSNGKEAKNVRRNSQMMKLFIVLLVCTAFIFSSAHFGAYAFEKTNINNQKYTSGTHIGFVAVSRKSPKKANLYNNTLKTQSNVAVSESVVKNAGAFQELQAFLKQGSKIEIPGQSNFSLLTFLKNKKLENISPETLSFIATGIYKAILPTNFSINEREIGNTLPSFSELGFEAKLDPEQSFDLAFFNPNKSTYILEMKSDNKNLMVTLIGGKFPFNYKISSEDVQYFKQKTIIQYSPLINPGQIKLKTLGIKGQFIRVYKEIYQGDMLVKRDLISEDFYPPVPAVEIHSLSSSTNGGMTEPSSQEVTQDIQPPKTKVNTNTNTNTNTNSATASPSTSQNSNNASLLDGNYQK